MKFMALIEDISIQREKEKEWVSQYGIMEKSNMESIIRIKLMVLLGSSGQVEIATGVRSNMVSTMAMAHFIGLTMERHTLGRRKMIRKMAMVYLHGLMGKLITDSIKMIKQKDLDSSSTRTATSMTVSGKITRDQAWQSGRKQQQESFKESSGKMTSASKRSKS
jgi:hypothetical protein